MSKKQTDDNTQQVVRYCTSGNGSQTCWTFVIKTKELESMQNVNYWVSFPYLTVKGRGQGTGDKYLGTVTGITRQGDLPSRLGLFLGSVPVKMIRKRLVKASIYCRPVSLG